ncbi:glycoside hydrolase family 76 protein [Moniliophthora roreri MCA 2997]|uniref:Glycoside hydrolase family 76 protein n=1 Tax=Moniliophthora roreri (strain MCA 2997) TaxID=1381753 RepID=V2WDD1_MONRO|nr:glycoside hydrolase family 76 protein [Moniliophthora roreri MCA 2997]
MAIIGGFWLLVGAITVCCPLIAGQYIPSSWRKPAITISQRERIQKAEAAIDQYLSTLPAAPESNRGRRSLTSSPLGNLLSLSQFCIEMADFDSLTGQERYKQALKSYISATERLVPGFASDFIRGGIAFGNAAARAYEIYGDDILLDYAVEAWNWGRRFTVSEENISVGTIPVKNFPLQKNCGTASMAGGTFAFNTTDDTQLDSWATGNFLVLSASLYKITSNETYLSAANTTANFLRSHMYRDQGLIVSTLSGKQGDQCQAQQDTPPLSTGMLMQGVSLLNSITSSVDDVALINDIVVGESLNNQWNNEDGVLTTMDPSGIYIPRGLLQVYNTTSDTSLQRYISAYLSTQYNAVIDLASGPGNIYARSWTGPSASSFNVDGQLNAISVLLAGILLSNDTVTITTIIAIPSTLPLYFNHTAGAVAALWFLVRRLLRKRRRDKITPIMNQGQHTNTAVLSGMLDQEVESTYQQHIYHRLPDNTMTPPEPDPEAEFLSRQRIYRRPAGKTTTPPDPVAEFLPPYHIKPPGKIMTPSAT